ncbi:MAG: TolC family protein [Alphaproteobacteria bacterium]|jgi:TolC family type I secretion outer membrane protein|nr:TolC family protein [Alphaproteobacteria bacterium]
MKNNTFKIVSLLTLAISTSAYAENLEEVLSHTYKNNPQIQSSIKDLEIADEKIYEAFSAFLPEITANVSLLDYDFEDENAFSQFMAPDRTYGASLSQPIFTGGQEFYAYKAIKRLKDIQVSTTQLKKDEIIIETASAYMNIIKTAGTHKLNLNSEKLRKNQLEATKAMFKAGSQTKTEVFSAESALFAAETNTVHSKGDLDIAKEKFKELTGKYPEDELEMPFIPELNLPQTKEEFIEKVLLKNNQIKIAKNNYQYYKAIKHTNIGNMLPQIKGTIDYSKSEWDNNDDLDSGSTKFAITASMDIFKGGRNLSKYEQDALKAESELHLYQNTKNEVTTQANELWTNYQTVVASKKSYKKQVSSAKNALDATVIEYKLGKKNIFDFQKAENDFIEASINLLDAQKDQITLYLQILSAMGELDKIID